MLKTRKCVIILLAQEIDERSVHMVKGWLEQHVPAWKDFAIKSCGKYLGVLIGPSASKDAWKSVLGKFDLRVRDIATSQASPCISAFSYNMRAGLVLSYGGFYFVLGNPLDGPPAGAPKPQNPKTPKPLSFEKIILKEN